MQDSIHALESHIGIFKGLFDSFEKDSALWKLAPEKWCMLEIVCHLYDEERDDFRLRTKWVMERPGEIPPPFNPLEWVESKKYMEQDYETMTKQFLEERTASISWLKSLNNPNWDHEFEHPKLGSLSAAYFLNNWVAHDLLHIRQILKLKFDYLQSRLNHGLDYAGPW